MTTEEPSSTHLSTPAPHDGPPTGHPTADETAPTESAGDRSITMGEGVLIVALTGFVYLLTFQHDAGYLSVFGIPRSFIDVRPTEAFATVLSIGFLVLLGMLWGYIVTPLERAFPRLKPFLFLGISSVALVIAAFWDSSPVSFSPLLFIVMVAAMFSDSLPIGDRRIAQILLSGVPRHTAAALRLTMVGIMVITLIYADSLGRSQARKDAPGLFVVPMETPTSNPASQTANRLGLLVVKPQGERWLCTEVNLDSGEVLPRIRVVDPVNLTAPAEQGLVNTLHFPGQISSQTDRLAGQPD